MLVRVSFTATQQGLTDLQEKTVVRVLKAMAVERFTHGSCVGGDAQLDAICRREFPDIPIVMRPCHIQSKRAMIQPRDIDKLLPPKDPLIRNMTMVNECDVLVGCPATDVEIKRSGTWMTIRYGKKLKKSVVIIYPDGRFERS